MLPFYIRIDYKAAALPRAQFNLFPLRSCGAPPNPAPGIAATIYNQIRYK